MRAANIDNYVCENCGFVINDDNLPTDGEIEAYFTDQNFRDMFGYGYDADEELEYSFGEMIAHAKIVRDKVARDADHYDVNAPGCGSPYILFIGATGLPLPA